METVISSIVFFTLITAAGILILKAVQLMIRAALSNPVAAGLVIIAVIALAYCVAGIDTAATNAYRP